MIVNYDRKTFIVQATGACFIKLFTVVIYGIHNKLECLSLVSGKLFQPSIIFAGKAFVTVSHF